MPKLIIRGRREIWFPLRHMEINPTLGGGGVAHPDLPILILRAPLTSVPTRETRKRDLSANGKKANLFRRIWGPHIDGYKELYLLGPLKVNRRFRGTSHPHLLGRRISQARYQREVLKTEATSSSETSVDIELTTRCYIQENRNIPFLFHSLCALWS
jgi:hypothetical protein